MRILPLTRPPARCLPKEWLTPNALETQLAASGQTGVQPSNMAAVRGVLVQVVVIMVVQMVVIMVVMMMVVMMKGHMK
jgi:hypothetical protein